MREIIKLEEFKKIAVSRFGEDTEKWKYVCPRCKTPQCAEDIVNAGVSKDEVHRYIGFSCIGRFDENQGCDWTLGGFLQFHELEIEDNEGNLHPHFALAETQAGDSDE